MSTETGGGAPQETGFTTEQLFQHAQLNATAVMLLTIAYLQEQRLPVEQWVAFVGQRFAPGWEPLREQGVRDLARTAALNVVSVGGRLVSLSGDAAQAEAVVTGWPAQELLDYVKLSQADADAFYRVFEAIAAHLGYRFTWQRDGEHVRLTFSR